MTPIIPQESIPLDGWKTKQEILSIYAVMQQLSDGRRKQGTRYPLALLLTYVLLAKAAGATSLQAISEWIRLRASWLQEMLPGVGKSFPCAATYSNVLRIIDAEQINEVLMSLLTRVQARAREVGQQQHIAVDGKTLRGTQHHLAEDQRKMHQVTMYEVQTGVILKEQVVQEKEGEQTRIGELLQPQWVKGRIFSADALHTHAPVCSRIVSAAGDYLLFAKGNQPTLQSDLHLFFSEPPLDCRDWREGETVNKGHGRREVRTLVASTELNDFLQAQWPGVAQVFRLRRRVTKALYCTQEWVYGFTSLTPAQADPQRLLQLIRDHWAIENRLHWRRDVTLREDHSQVRKGMAPRIMAILNSFLLALFDWLHVINVPRQMRIFDAQPYLALRLLFLSLPRIK